MADRYIFTREFWNLDHPKVVALSSGAWTEEQFVKSLRPDDPFMMVRDNKQKDLVMVVGYDAKEVERRDTSLKEQIRKNTASTGGMPSVTADADRELISENFPDSLPIYAKIDDMECKECKGGLKNRIVIEMFASCKEKPRPDLIDKFKTKLTSAAVKLLSGEEPDAVEAPPTPFSKMKKVGSVKRPVLFACPIVCQGANEEICRRCRSEADFRKEMVKHFDVPPTYQVRKGSAESYTVATIGSPSETYDFACPYRQDVENKFPSVTKMTANVAVAGFRILRAIVEGKDVTVGREGVAKREGICKECPKHEKDSNRCYECGCFLDYKIPLSTEKCPLGKW